MAPTTPSVISLLELNLPKPRNWMEQNEPIKPKTPSQWFALKFPDQAAKYGCPFLEMRESSCDGFTKLTPISINIDFFAGMLAGDVKLGHSVIYFEPEMQFYYIEPMLQLYRPTTPEKLQNYYRAMLLRCAQELNNETDKLNLFLEFRSDKVAKQVTNRAKSILAADSSFFSASSPHQRIKGPELHQRIAQVFVEQIERDPGQILTLKCAYDLFSQLLKQKNMEALSRGEVKVMLGELIREQFGLGIRNDLISSESPVQMCGWKGLRLA